MENKSTRKTFDFKQYPDVLKFLNNNPNMTQYIVDLIRQDIRQDSSKIDKEVIFAIIEEYLQTRNIVVTDKPLEDIDTNKLKVSALKIIGIKV